MGRHVELLALVFALSLVPENTVTAQEQPVRTDEWEILKRLVGSWEGAIDGPLGTGSGVREYEFILRDRFLLSRHSSVRLPQELSPQGDNHEELGIFSFDAARSKFVYRQFVVEGFVNQYVCEMESEQRKFVCVTESVENGGGLRARWTMTMVNDYVVDEIFELAELGGELRVFFRNRWERMPRIR